MRGEPVALELTVVDAFTDRPFAGNPAAVCLVEAFLDDGLMQAVAAELNLSETAFAVERAPDRYDLRSPPRSRCPCAATPRWPPPT